MSQLTKVLFFTFLSFFTLFGFLLRPSNSYAEIATPRDWIGIFPVDTGIWVNNKSNASKWLYSATCNQAVAGPSLSGSCNLTTSTLNPGAYELRYNINDTDAMLSESKVLWTPISLSAKTISCSPSLSILLSWPKLLGVTAINVERSQDNGPFSVIQTIWGGTSSYTDILPSNPSTKITYNYRLDSFTTRGVDSYSNTASISSINNTCNPDQTNASCYISSSPIVTGNFTQWVGKVSGGDNNKTFIWSSYVNTLGQDAHSGNTQVVSIDSSTNPSTFSSVWNLTYNLPGTAHTSLTITDPPYTPVFAQCSASSATPTPPSNLNVNGDVHSNGQ